MRKALSRPDADLREAFQTFAAHSHPGTLLFLDINNAAACLPCGTFECNSSKEVITEKFRASVRVSFRFDHRRQLMIRRRVWIMEEEEPVEDYCEYRLLFPAELEAWLAWAGFNVTGIHDNMELEDSPLTGSRLYVSAISRS